MPSLSLLGSFWLRSSARFHSDLWVSMPDNLADAPVFQRVVRRDDILRTGPFAAENVGDILAFLRYTRHLASVFVGSKFKRLAVHIAKRRAKLAAPYGHHILIHDLYLLHPALGLTNNHQVHFIAGQRLIIGNDLAIAGRHADA